MGSLKAIEGSSNEIWRIMAEFKRKSRFFFILYDEYS